MHRTPCNTSRAAADCEPNGASSGPVAAEGVPDGMVSPSKGSSSARSITASFAIATSAAAKSTVPGEGGLEGLAKNLFTWGLKSLEYVFLNCLGEIY